MTADRPGRDEACPLGWVGARCGRFGEIGPCGCEPPAAVAARPAGQAEETLRRPDEWCRIKSVRVLDPDGWRDDDAPSWIEPISEAEFDRRLSRCTEGPWDWETNQPRRPSSPSSPVPDEVRATLLDHHPIMRSETGPFSGCRCGQVRLGQDVIAHVVEHLRRALDGQP